MAIEPEWYEIFGDRTCLNCGQLLSLTEIGNFCKMHASDILMGVGSVYYPTSKSFIDEAAEQGCSKRIGRYISPDIKPGVTRCFLIHNTEKLIFGFFFVSGIEIIVKEGLSISEELKRRGIVPIEITTIESEKERGCGKRKSGGAYITSYVLDKEDIDKIKRDRSLVKATTIKGPLIVFKDPIPYENLKYTIRSYEFVNGDNIIKHLPSDTWKWKKPIPKAEHEEKKFKSLEAFF